MNTIQEIKEMPAFLEKLGGLSVEGVLLLLGQTKRQIWYRPLESGYIRVHEVIVHPLDARLIPFRQYVKTGTLTMESAVTLCYAAKALYKPTRDFDWSALDGRYEFKNGLFVEYTFIRQRDITEFNLP